MIPGPIIYGISMFMIIQNTFLHGNPARSTVIATLCRPSAVSGELAERAQDEL